MAVLVSCGFSRRCQAVGLPLRLPAPSAAAVLAPHKYRNASWRCQNFHRIALRRARAVLQRRCAVASSDFPPRDRLLFQFAEDNKDAVRATYLLSGWTAADGDSVRARRFIIAKDEDLEQAVASLETLSCAHVYSVTAAPGGAPSASALWATESAALWDMFNSAPEEKNCLRDNRCGDPVGKRQTCVHLGGGLTSDVALRRHGHIKCSKVVRDLQPRRAIPSLARRLCRCPCKLHSKLGKFVALRLDSRAFPFAQPCCARGPP